MRKLRTSKWKDFTGPVANPFTAHVTWTADLIGHFRTVTFTVDTPRVTWVKQPSTDRQQKVLMTQGLIKYTDKLFLTRRTFENYQKMWPNVVLHCVQYYQKKTSVEIYLVTRCCYYIYTCIFLHCSLPILYIVYLLQYYNVCFLITWVILSWQCYTLVWLGNLFLFLRLTSKKE